MTKEGDMAKSVFRITLHTRDVHTYDHAHEGQSGSWTGLKDNGEWDCWPAHVVAKVEKRHVND